MGYKHDYDKAMTRLVNILKKLYDRESLSVTELAKEMPKKNDIREFLQSRAMNYEHTQSILMGKESIYIGLLDGLKEELSKISKKKLLLFDL